MSNQEKIADLKRQLALAHAQIEELKALVLSLVKPAKTSRNSHNPPSGDKGRGSRDTSLRGKSGRSSGGQKGHKGHTLEMVTSPDEVYDLRPDFCNACGLSLQDLPQELEGRRQVVDIPPIRLIVKEYRNYAVACACGHRQCGAFPAGVSNHVQYGPNVQAMAVYLSCYQFLPFARLRDFFHKVCGVLLCQGTLENIIRRSSAKAQPAYEAIKEAIGKAKVVGSDETSFRHPDGKNWFWVWQNKSLTYLFAAKSRSKSVIEGLFPNGFPRATLVSDRLSAQRSTKSLSKQTCIPHLLRELNYLSEAEGANWAPRFKDALQKGILLKQKQAEYPDDHPETRALEKDTDDLLCDQELMELLKEPKLHLQTIRFFNSMVRIREELFTFLYEADVPFDNNGSERAFRMVKVKTKISGYFKSLQQEFAVVRSVIDTAIKNGQSVFQAITALVEIPMPPKAAG